MSRALIAIALLAIWPAVPSATQDPVQEAAELYGSGDFDKAREKFAQLLKEHPDEAEVLYYLSKLEPSADKALEYRQRFLFLYPEHRLADEVLYGVAQYHFALGYYLTAAKDYGQLLQQYPQSSLRPEAIYWLASSKLAIGASDSAAFYFRRIIGDHGDSPMVSWAELGLADALYMGQLFSLAKSQCLKFLQEQENSPLLPVALFRMAEIHEALGERAEAMVILERLATDYSTTYQGQEAQRQLTEWGSSVQAAKPAAQEEDTYVIQVGAFGEKANALNLEIQLRTWGYEVEIVQRAGRHRTLYLVWVGQYRNVEEATREAKILENKRGLPYQIVKR